MMSKAEQENTDIKFDNKLKKEYKTPIITHLGEMKQITRYEVSVIVN